MGAESTFLNEILEYIRKEDPLHYKKVRKNIEELSNTYNAAFFSFVGLISKFCDERKLTAPTIASHYLKMVNDMRVEGVHFKKTGQYSCKNQDDAYVNVYSRVEIMEYYMNALLLSQVLWTHHFKMLMFFSQELNKPFLSQTKKVLDIGPGHGFFSNLVIENLRFINHVDIVDISDGSLAMTRSVIGDGNGKISYYNRNIFKYESSEKYDLIILGEVLEHLDDPLQILRQLSAFMHKDSYLWITTPTNAPALDHVYLFRSKEEITSLLISADFEIVDEFGCYAEDVKEDIALKFDISYLYGAFLRKMLIKPVQS